MAKVENVVRRLEDMGYQIRVEKTTKNGVELTAITNMCGTICPICYFEDITEDNVSDEVAAERIRNVFERSMRQNPMAFVDMKAFIESLDEKSLEARICKSGNAGEGVVAMPFLEDLEIYPVIVFNFDGERGSVKITEDIIKNISWLQAMANKHQYLYVAMDNSFKKTKTLKYSKVLIDTIKRAYVAGEIEEFEEANDMIKAILQSGVDEQFGILSNDELYGGAIAIANSEALAKYAESIDDDFYIIPSSIHEIICVKASYVAEDLDAESMLRSLVTEVNATEVDPRDKLTDNVYFYSRYMKSVASLIKIC